MKRVAVVGVTGAGKTTLAMAPGARLGLPFVELDRLYWQPNWKAPPREEFRARIVEAVRADAWVMDGNYALTRAIVWPAADTLVWLDYQLPLILSRLLWRTFRRTLGRELLWGINRERFFVQFYEPGGLFRWALETYPRYRREFPQQYQLPACAHLHVVRLRTPREASLWLGRLP